MHLSVSPLENEAVDGFPLAPDASSGGRYVELLHGVVVDQILQSGAQIQHCEVAHAYTQVHVHVGEM